MTVEEYRIAQLYTVADMSKSETKGDTGVEILKNEPFEDAVMGKGQYTHKIYYIKSHLNPVIAALLPNSAMVLEEKAWNAYPYCKTVLTNKFMGENMHIIIETIHAEGNCDQENIHNLGAEDLAKREVIPIDISVKMDNPKYYEPENDPSLFKSEKTGRGPLQEGWQAVAKPVMTCYKLCRMRFKWFGLQSTVESIMAKEEFKVFKKFHQKLFCSIDKWFGLTMEDIRVMEEEAKKELDAKLNDAEIEGREKN